MTGFPKTPRSGHQWVEAFVQSARRLNVHVNVGLDNDVLDKRGAEAILYQGNGEYWMVLRSDPTASAVLEEFAHVLQHHRKRFLECEHEEIEPLREIEAKECLLEHASKLRLDESESERTRILLERDRHRLTRIRSLR
jgi:hypothetical protein